MVWHLANLGDLAIFDFDPWACLKIWIPQNCNLNGEDDQP